MPASHSTPAGLTAPARRVPIATAAAFYGVSPKTVRRRIADGTIPAHRLGPRLIRVDLADVEAALRLIPAGGGPHGDTAA